jgi:exopolysaccharide biosynthesis WecB/TagA/CpsF family protein
MTGLAGADEKREFFGVRFSRLERLEDVVRILERSEPAANDPFRYIVTPNADHIVRIAERPGLREIYNNAWICLNDSRVLQLLLGAGGFHLPAIRGSDLVNSLLGSQWPQGKKIVVIGGDEQVRRWLLSLPTSQPVQHYNPPMGFIQSREAVDDVLDFIAQHLPAYVFLAVGSPNQEIVADACVRRGLRGGIAFCVGAAILMSAGFERRAPHVLQSAGLEWLYRLARDPQRLAGRYWHDVGVLRLVAHELVRRRAPIA